MVTLTQLEYIVAVEKFRNFSLAAKSCFVTQPTLSMQIQKLEEQLGVVIFDRSSQPIKATPIGQKVLDQARIVLSQASLITELINQEKQRVQGELRLGIIPTLAPYLLPLFLGKLAADYPDIDLHVEESKTDDIIVALRKNQLDVGLLVTPLDEPQIVEHPLFQEPFYVYAAKGSALAKLSEVSDDDLKDEELLLLAEGHCMREQTLRVCRNRRTRTKTVGAGLQFESGSIETLCHLVEKGHGYTIIPHLSKTWQETKAGRVIPFTAPSPSRQVSIVTHHSFVRDSLLQALSTSILATLPPELKRPAKDLKTVKIR